MPSCFICKKPVVSGYVLDSECMEKLNATVRERDHYKKALESIHKYGDYTGYLAGKALEEVPVNESNSQPND